MIIDHKCGGALVTIYPDLQKKIDELWVKYPDMRVDGINFETHVNSMLETAVEAEEYSRKKTLPLHLVAVLKDSVVLGDLDEKKIVYVDFINEGVGLRCQEHGSQDCLHIGFCLAIPKVYRRLWPLKK